MAIDVLGTHLSIHPSTHPSCTVTRVKRHQHHHLLARCSGAATTCGFYTTRSSKQLDRSRHRPLCLLATHHHSAVLNSMRRGCRSSRQPCHLLSMRKVTCYDWTSRSLVSAFVSYLSFFRALFAPCARPQQFFVAALPVLKYTAPPPLYCL